MTDVQTSFVAAGTCLLVAVLSQVRSRQFHREEPERQVRNHLNELFKIFVVLFFYYAARGAFQRLGYHVEIDDSSGFSPGAAYAYHGFAMLICLATNVLLLRAVGMIEHPLDDPQSQQGSSLRARASRQASNILDLSTEQGVLWSGLLSICILGVPLANGYDYHPPVVRVAYIFGLLPSCALFFRLSRVYFFGVKVPILGGIAIAYGALQFAYPFVTPGVLYDPYHLALIGGKLFFGIAVVVLARHLVPESGAQGEPRSEHEVNDLRIRAVGDRLEMLTKARLLVQYSAFSLSAFGLAVVITAVTKQGLIRLYMTGGADRLIAATAALGLFAGYLVAIQFAAYFTLFRHAFPVDWAWHSQNSLRGLYKVSAPETFGCVRIRALSMTSRVHSETGSLIQRPPRSERQTRVILINGVFSNSEQAWGLLPLLLLRQRGVESVQLVEYGRRMFIGEQAVNSCQADLENALSQLADDHPGDSVVIGHSLGGLLAMRALAKLCGKAPDDSCSRIRQLVLLAVPLSGSPAAWLGLPWGWMKRLQWNAEWVHKTVEQFVATFPPPGLIAGEPDNRPSCSFLTASRDNVAGSHSVLLMIPGQRIPISGWHSSINRVFRDDRDHCKQIVRQLRAVPRSVRLAHLLCAHSIGTSHPRLAVSFESEGEPNPEHALIHSDVIAIPGQAINVPDRPATRDGHRRSLMSRLQEAYEATRREENWTAESAARIPDWEIFWVRFVERSTHAALDGGLIRMDWGRSATLYARFIGNAGYAVVLAERLRSKRDSEAAA